MSGIVVIGAGQAAGQAVASLRQEGYEGSITLLGDEAQVPYQRPPLSKAYLAGEIGIDRMLVRPESFYADKQIALRTSARVNAIDPDAKNVTTESGESLDYDKLLIATGSRPRLLDLPGSDLQGIYYLRTLEDVDAIRQDLGKAKRLCIVGGGYIGLEVASGGGCIGPGGNSRGGYGAHPAKSHDTGDERLLPQAPRQPRCKTYGECRCQWFHG